MRIIFGIGSKLFVWESSVSKVAMRVASESSDTEDEEDYKAAPPQDPHGTLSSHCEISPAVLYDSAKADRRFGFGSQANG